MVIIHAAYLVFCMIVSGEIMIGTISAMFVLSCFFCGTYRVFIITGRKALSGFLSQKNKESVRVIIYGAGEAGKFLANMLTVDRSKKITVVAFVDDNKKLHGQRVKGYMVAGGREAIASIVKKYRAQQIIIAIPHVDHLNFREIVEICCKTGCQVRRFANMSDLNINDLSKATIHDINVEDLLGREPVTLDLKGVNDLLKHKAVLVTGGAGSIGSEICRQLLRYETKRVIILDINENGLFKIDNELRGKYEGRYRVVVGSVKDKTRLDEILDQYRPHIVFHAAAYKHVPIMEINPVEAVDNNVMGTRNLMLSAVEHQVENFIMISTDKAVNPTNIMGATKRIAELLCKYMNALGSGTKFSAVRFGNVLGSNGSVIPIFKEQIRRGGPVTVTDREIQRYFMTIPEAVQLVMEAASVSQGGELFKNNPDIQAKPVYR